MPLSFKNHPPECRNCLFCFGKRTLSRCTFKSDMKSSIVLDQLNSSVKTIYLSVYMENPSKNTV